MMKTLLSVLFFFIGGVVCYGQVILTNASPSVTIDFSNSTPASVGTTPQTAFAGSGFEPNPTTAGRLNSNAWAVTGFSDGSFSFGGSNIIGDYVRGATNIAVITGGIYAYTGTPQSIANPCLMIQPSASDFAPGTITLRVVNNGSNPISQLSIVYNLFVRNDEGRANSLNFSYSSDNLVYTELPVLDYTTPEVSDLSGWVKVGGTTSRSTTISGLEVQPLSYFYLRWNSDDVSGSGSRDEIGLDDIAISATYNSNSISISSLSSTVFNLTDCFTTTGGSLNFTATGTFNAGNVYTVQMSNSSGSFAAPVNIGTLSSNSLSGTINFTIPAGTLSGSNYLFRVVSSDYYTISLNSSLITINQSGSCITNSTDYFRSRQSGNWGNVSTWESSNDNTTWISATQTPTSAANTITIKPGHTVTIAANTSADQLTIESGAVLIHNNSSVFTLNDGTGTDMIINGTYVIYGSVPAGAGTYSVENGGIIRADNNNGGTADNLAWSSNLRATFKTGSVFEWNTPLAFNTDNIILFASGTEKPIFRITANVGTVGAGTNTIVNGLFEVNGSVTLSSAGTKTFRDGIIGTGSVIQTNTCGAMIISGTSAQLGGSGTITLNTGGLQIAPGAQVALISNKIINGAGFDFTNNGLLDCAAFIVSGSSNFIHAASAILGIGSVDGITSSGGVGNIQTTGRSYSSSANYTYKGIANQVTGNFSTTPVGNTINSLNIANTGNTVTLTNNNLTTTTLYLNSGLFASGTNQTLKIAAGGIIYGNGGNNPNDPSAGNIEFLGDGSTNGYADRNPYLYSVIAKSATDFNGLSNTGSATIMNRLQLNSGSYVTDAPYYQNGSSLVYNINGAYGRNVEWGAVAGSQGYPHNVTVQGNTILNLYSNAITPSQLAIGGDLIIGNSTGWGRVYMNGTWGEMTKPLSVGGSLIIGSTDAASNSSELWLSNTNGGDLWLYGSFSRYPNSYYTDNSRAIFFKGSSNGSINTPGIPITPGVPTQYFSYVLLEKNIGTETITLNCPVGINNSITFTKGVISSSINNLLVVVNGASSTAGSSLSFVNGPMRKIGNTDFTFPVGKIVVSEYHHRTISVSGLSSNLSFTAEFRRQSATLLGPVTAPGPPPLTRVSYCEYWTLDRTEASGNANVTLTWSAQSPCNTASYISDLPTLVIAHFDNTSWNQYGANSRTGDVTAGSVTWNAVNTFSPFSLGSISINENILPLDLSSFTARARKTDVLIDWNVMNNNDQEEYILERSKDGVNFKTLKVVPAKVILNQAAYAEVDLNPYNGWNYYRLKAIDKLNRAKTSQVVKVWFGANEVVRISPNPASEKIVINLSEPSSISQIELVNISGQVLKQVNAIQFTTEINISQLQAGMYFLRIMGKNGLTLKAFVKN